MSDKVAPFRAAKKPKKGEDGLNEATKLAIARSVCDIGMEAKTNVLEKTNPEKAAHVLELLARGVGIKKITALTGCDWYTLCGLRSRHCRVLEQRRESVAMDALDLMEGARLLQMEKMRLLAEDEGALKRANLRDLAMSYGVYNEAFHRASEGNRVVIEHKSGAPSVEDAIAAIEAAKKALRASSVEVNVTPAKGEDKGESPKTP